MNVDDIAHAQIERLRNFLPTEDDVTLIVLKGHLLAEETLDELIELRCVEPQHLENTRISFGIKMILARALCGDIVWKGSWPLLEKLNQLRNGLAHNLDSPKLPRLVSAFLTERRAQVPLIHDVKTDPTDPKDMIRRLRSDVSMLVSQLIAAAIMIRDLNISFSRDTQPHAITLTYLGDKMTNNHDQGLVNIYVKKIQGLGFRALAGDKVNEEIKATVAEALERFDFVVTSDSAVNLAALSGRLKILCDIANKSDVKYLEALKYAISHIDCTKPE